jgi:cytochrome c553
MNQRCRSFLKLVLAFSLLGSSFLFGRALDSGGTLFEKKVLPIFEQNCFFCHSEIVQRSGLNLRSQESILKGGSQGPAVTPGNAQTSLLYQLINHTLEPHMPMGGAKLANSEIAQIAEWINALPTDRPKLPPGVLPVRIPGYKITEQDRLFWSFQKPVRRQIPAVKNRGWIRNEVDAFILSRLEEKNLRPSPPAEPVALLRRVYFDLIGLPPSPQEIDAFLADRSANAFEKVIDRLLASPHYGERWGRHWLDLARYADSGGFEFDYDRPHAWRYRDYVIRSFNEDKPYDQFIKEQLAADELNPAKPENLIATGFCRNGPTVDNASNEQTRMDELDDMVSTTSSVFLGLTVGCARCHDHKYDPIPQKDYYRLQAIFFSTQKTDQLLVDRAAEEAFKAANKEVDAKVKPYRDKIAIIEQPHRAKLLAEKVDFFVRVAMQAGALEGKDPEAYRAGLTQQFARDVKLQPEEIDALLTPEERRARGEIQLEIEKINRLRPKPLPRAMGITNKESETAKCFLLKRGDFRQKGEEVRPGFPSVLVDAVVAETTAGAKNAVNRTRLSEWIASPEHPLTARVAVNRVWQHHFGKGIVRTSSDFGVNGDRPSHPELLDWLAAEFTARRWSFKAMHRLILSSSTYRQSNRFVPPSAAIDPENRLFWRMNPLRLEAEVIRDSVLAISGKLNPKMEGPGIYPRIDPSVISAGSTKKWPVDVKEGPPEWRRSVYIFVKRSVLLPLIEVFDCPDTTVSTPARNASIVAPQALALLNNGFVLEQSEHFARRVLQEAGADSREQIRYAYKLALARNATAKELSWSLDFLSRQTKSYGAAELGSEASPKLAALRDFCHALFNLNEFLYVD